MSGIAYKKGLLACLRGLEHYMWLTLQVWIGVGCLIGFSILFIILNILAHAFLAGELALQDPPCCHSRWQAFTVLRLPGFPAWFSLALESPVLCCADKLEDVRVHALLHRQGQKRSKRLQGLPGGEGSSHPWVS